MSAESMEKTIAFLVYPGFTAFDVTGPLHLLAYPLFKRLISRLPLGRGRAHPSRWQPLVASVG